MLFTAVVVMAVVVWEKTSGKAVESNFSFRKCGGIGGR